MKIKVKTKWPAKVVIKPRSPYFDRKTKKRA